MVLSSSPLATSPPSLQNQCGARGKQSRRRARHHRRRRPIRIRHVDAVRMGWTTEAQQSPRLSPASNRPDGNDQSRNLVASGSWSFKPKCSLDLQFPRASVQAGGKAQKLIYSLEKTEVWNSLSFIEGDACMQNMVVVFQECHSAELEISDPRVVSRLPHDHEIRNSGTTELLSSTQPMDTPQKLAKQHRTCPPRLLRKDLLNVTPGILCT